MSPSTRSRGPCVDCPSPAPGRRPRPAPYPGPRCFTHNHAVVKARKARRHERHVVRTYRGVGPGDYERIWEHQGRRCAICGRRLHTTKKGALEHDHRLDWPSGVTCAVCNDFLGYIARDPLVALALFRYLVDPPAWHVIGPPPELMEPPF